MKPDTPVIRSLYVQNEIPFSWRREKRKRDTSQSTQFISIPECRVSERRISIPPRLEQKWGKVNIRVAGWEEMKLLLPTPNFAIVPPYTIFSFQHTANVFEEFSLFSLSFAQNLIRSSLSFSLSPLISPFTSRGRKKGGGRRKKITWKRKLRFRSLLILFSSPSPCVHNMAKKQRGEEKKRSKSKLSFISNTEIERQCQFSFREIKGREEIVIQPTIFCNTLQLIHVQFNRERKRSYVLSSQYSLLSQPRIKYKFA